ncbi:MAG: site-2 protease family protein [Rhodocyclaceae bacterium]|nr:site-2 protease family protein [Rhodocyclaceae bacterium]
MENIIQTLAIYALPVIFAITLHEAAHGYAARHFGDPTAWQMGRITLNPVKHIDMIGTLLVPALILFVSKGAFLFGWAKPVPVNFGRLRRPKQDMFWVAAAGPGANLFMACAWALLLKLAVVMPVNAYSLPLAEMCRAGITVNAVLMLLNLLPIPPLDGGRIAVSLLPHGVAWRLARVEPYGFFILLALLFLGVLQDILTPLLRVFLSLIKALFFL